MSEKAKKSKWKSTLTSKAAIVAQWVKDEFGTKPTTGRTSDVIAAMCGKVVGFEVNPNAMARELYRQNIEFRVTDADPPRPVWSKNEMLRVVVGKLEVRIRAIEDKIQELDGTVLRKGN